MTQSTYTQAKAVNKKNETFTENLLKDIRKVNKDTGQCPLTEELNNIIKGGNPEKIGEMRAVMSATIQPILRKAHNQRKLLGEAQKTHKIRVILNDDNLYHVVIEEKDETPKLPNFWEEVAKLQALCGVSDEDIIDHFMRIEEKRAA